METPPTFSIRGCSIFESGPEIEGTLTMKLIQPAITFEWKPQDAEEVDINKMNYEKTTIFFFLHRIKKLSKTKTDNGNTILRFSLQDVRTATQFVFPPSSSEGLDQMMQYLISQNYIQQVPSDPTSFNVLLEVTKKFVPPEGTVSLQTISPLISHRTVTAKLISEQKNLPKPKDPITFEEFNSFFDENHKLTNFAKFKQEIFSRGLEPDVRPHAYLYLLNIMDPNLSDVENTQRKNDLFKEFESVLTRWKARIPEQEKYSHSFHGVIISDVRRTERNYELFKKDGPAHKALEEILVCFSIELPDTGYIQGMCDLVSTLMQLFIKEVKEDQMLLFNDKTVSFIEGEALIFWAFYGLLCVTGHDILFMDMDSNRTFVAERVFALLQANAPSESRWLTAIEQESLLFTLSPFILIFKRWFKLPELLKLWDALLANEDPVSYLRFFLAAALILTFPNMLIAQDKSGDVSTSFNTAISTLNVNDLIDIANVLIIRTKKDDMHTQWIFMRYPEDITVNDYEPKFIKLC